MIPGLRTTWAPVPCIQQQDKKKKSFARFGVPLKLARALTIHKAQGITEPNGVVVSFDGSCIVFAVSRMGLAFVAWTRTSCWERMAFFALPPLEDFVALRFPKEFHARSRFEPWADEQHHAHLAARRIDEGQHMQQHQKHLRGVLRRKHQQEATEEELLDMQKMPRAHGVAPICDNVLHLRARQRVRAGGGGFWSIVSSFLAKKQATA